MTVPPASDSCPECRALGRQLSRATAELAEARAATEAARRAAVSAQERNLTLLAERERTVTVPELAQLRERSQLLDLVLATRTFRWSRLPRRAYGAVRRLGRRTVR